MRKKSKTGKVWVLISGGIDSSACLAFYLQHDFSVEGIFIDYGQSAALRESQAVKALSDHYGIPLRSLQLHGAKKKSKGLIYGRNVFLLFTALMEVGTSSGLIAIGIHSGSPYYDCSGDFLERVQPMFDAYTDGRIRPSAPFLEWSKREVWDFCHTAEVPINLTYSCELGEEQPCGKCLSCKDLEALRAG